MDDFLKITTDEYTPLRDVVFKTLRKAILNGNLKPGERLMEMHLSSRMGVSRTPIREAIRMLELEGLVIMVPRCGARVAQISFKNLSDVLEVRGALEELAIRLACERADDNIVAKLKEAAVKFEQATKTKNEIEIAQADVRFHDIIVEAADNDRLAQLTQNLSEQYYRYRYEYVKDNSSHEKLVSEHYEMVTSIEEKDIERAVRAMRLHIEKQEKAIARNLHLEDNEDDYEK